MYKALKAIEFDGTTFGMSVDAGTETYKKFKAQVKEEEIISIFGDHFTAHVVCRGQKQQLFIRTGSVALLCKCTYILCGKCRFDSK